MAAVTPRATVLALNNGSSSLKFGLYDADGASATAQTVGSIETTDDHGALFDRIEAALAGCGAPTTIGHRIVHGGPHRGAHCLIDNASSAIWRRRVRSHRCMGRRRWR